MCFARACRLTVTSHSPTRAGPELQLLELVIDQMMLEFAGGIF